MMVIASKRIQIIRFMEVVQIFEIVYNNQGHNG